MTGVAGGADDLPPLPEPALFAPQMITEDAYTADQMRAYVESDRARRQPQKMILAHELPPELREKALTLLARWDKDDDYSLGMLLDDFDGILSARRQGAEAQVERMEDALQQIKNWAQAYPISVFHVPTDDEWARLHQAARDAGLNGLDAFSADNMRHVVTEVQKIVDAALSLKGAGD